MKSILAVAIFVALTAAATAKLAPVADLDRSADRTAALASNDINISPSAARERDYFQAPRSQFNTGNVSCRLQLSVFDKTRLAQSCN